MKLALISDIHGNLPALEAVMNDLEREAVDQLVCLGDVASFGPQPKEALQQVRALACPVVMGNTDAWLLSPRKLEDVANPSDDSPRFIAIETWCAERLDDEDRAFIRTFKPTVGLELDGLKLLCFHGSPGSHNDLITATTPDERLAELLAAHDATLMAGGHTHAQLLRRFRHITFVNPGSVGLPYETHADGSGARNPPWAEYAILTTVRGQASLTFRRVPYDVRPVLEAALRSGMPHTDFWTKNWDALA